MSRPCPVFVYGTGGFGREAAWLLRDVFAHAFTLAGSGRTQHQLMGFLDDDRRSGALHGLPVLTPEEAVKQYGGARYVVGVGNPATRERIVERAEQIGLTALSAAFHPTVQYDYPTVSAADGTLVCAGCILTVDIAIGRHVHLNLDCTVGHDVVIEDFVTVAPGVHVSGNVTLGRGAEIGTGAVIRQGVTVGAGSVVGMGAVLTKDVPPDETWVGNPARRLGEATGGRPNERRR